MHARVIHGGLAAIAMVVLLPWGSILMRVVPGRWAMKVHATMQMVALVVYFLGAAVGITLVRDVRIPGQSGGLVSIPFLNKGEGWVGADGGRCRIRMSNIIPLLGWW